MKVLPIITFHRNDMKNTIDYSSLENKIYKKAYRLSDVKDQLESVAFDIVRFKVGIYFSFKSIKKIAVLIVKTNSLHSFINW